TEPDFKNSDEVIEWLKQLTATLKYLKLIDKNLGIKADVNVSLPELNGVRVEIKNVNSLRNIKKAIDYEIERQKKSGELAKEQETRMFNESKNITIRMRTKEKAQDYRFISDPDLPVIKLEKKRVEKIKKELPETPQEKIGKLIKKYKIEKKYAEVLAKNLDIAEFFEKIVQKINSNLAAQWVTGELLSVLNHNKKELDEVDINPEHFIELLKLLGKNEITELNAKEILRKFIPESFSPKQYAEKHSKISSDSEIEKAVDFVIRENPKAVSDFKEGQENALNFLIGKVMAKTEKRADYKTAREILERKLR
ncbi:MAG: Asp-tRNA(Asn)/Glu-tRNA(Gln) amidotransferase GatCAB subunit B, partial [Nanoarchaeota archaeon]